MGNEAGPVGGGAADESVAGGFADAGHPSRLGSLSVKHSGWGLGLFDFNNDGWKDLFTANSHVNDLVEKFEPAVYREKNSVFANAGGVFRDVSDEAGLNLVKAHRGAAFADFNGDGRIDAVVSALGETAELWNNLLDSTLESLLPEKPTELRPHLSPANRQTPPCRRSTRALRDQTHGCPTRWIGDPPS